jgi:CRISPR-associated endonuclease Csn1
VTDRWLLNRISHEAGARGHEAAHRMAADLPEPWDGFSDDLRRIVQRIVVSHRQDHGTVAKAGLPKGRDATAGRLHNDTAYGFTGEKDKRGIDIVVHRRALSALTKPEDLEQVRDPDLRAALLDFTAALGNGLAEKERAAAFKERIASFPQLGPAHYRGIRRVRVTEPLTVIPIRDKAGRIYKGYKGDSNYRYDVWELKDGTWVAEIISTFDVHQSGFVSALRRENPTARKVLSLHQNDAVAIEPDGGGRKLMRIVKFSQSIVLADLHEAGDLKRRDAEKNEVDPFKYVYLSASGLKRVKARQVRIDELGRVLDPGPRDRPDRAP